MKRFAILMILALVVGCSHEPPPRSGYVLEKSYDDPDDWTYDMPIYSSFCSGSGAYRICTQIQTGFIPISGHDGPHWSFRVKDDKKVKRSAWVDVDQSTYDKFEVGMHWPDPR